MPPSGAAASAIQGKLFFALRSWRENKTNEGLLLQDVSVELPRHQFLAPESRGGLAPDAPGSSRRDRRRTRTRLEVLSPTTRVNDLGVKHDHYLDVGVRERWLADPAAKTLLRARRSPSDEELASVDTLTSALLPGFSLALARAFRAE